MGTIIQGERSLVLALKTKHEPDSFIAPSIVHPAEAFIRLVRATNDIKGLGGYKLDAGVTDVPNLGGLIVEATRLTSREIPFIWDLRGRVPGKLDIGTAFTAENKKPDIETRLRMLKSSGMSAIIGVPQFEIEIQRDWVSACNNVGLEIIIGGNNAPDDSYICAAKMGVTNFIAPVIQLQRYAKFLRSLMAEGISPNFFLKDQELKAHDVHQTEGLTLHQIAGIGITDSREEVSNQRMRTLANKLIGQLMR